MIVKNGAMVATVWAESIPRWSTSTNVAVLSLDHDEQVWLLLLRVMTMRRGNDHEEIDDDKSVMTSH